jgi:hypothetical protein
MVELIEGGELRTVRKIVKLATKSLRELTKSGGNPAKAEQCHDNLMQALLPFRILREGDDKSQTLDETERLSRALPYLLKLERYERRGTVSAKARYSQVRRTR